MIRISTLLALLPAPALAHSGHWDTLAGHDHWIALGALGLAGLIGLAALAKGRGRRKDETDGTDEPEGGEQEA